MKKILITISLILLLPSLAHTFYSGGGGGGGISSLSLDVEAHGNQSGTLSASLETYLGHSLTVTGNLAITTTNWTSAVYQEATYIVNYDTSYTLTIDGLSMPWLEDGWNTVVVSKIDGTTTVMRGMTNTLGALR